jgi:hypothetical protein
MSYHTFSSPSICMIHYWRACVSHDDFDDNRFLLVRKLQNQGFLLVNIISSLWKLYGHHHGSINKYGHFVSQKTFNILLSHRKHFRYSFVTYRRIFKMSNMIGASSGTRTSYRFCIVLWQWFVILSFFCCHSNVYPFLN